MNLENINMRKIQVLYVAAAVLLSACSPKLQVSKSEKTQYAISKDLPQDSSILKYYAPYKAKIDAEMNTVVAVAAIDLDRGRPEGTLSNLMADAMFEVGKQNGLQFDVAYTNYGALRIPIPKGDIPLYKVFELMPFENTMTLVTFSGADMQKFFEYVAKQGGDPISGVKFKISNKMPLDITIGGKPLDLSRSYTILTSDYMANGGDGGEIFSKASARKDTPIKLRDAIIQYLKQQTAAGKKINPQIDGRITVQ